MHVSSEFLLSDAEIVQFIIDGFLLLRTELPLDFHEKTCEQINTAFDTAGKNPDNEIFEMVPTLYDVYSDARIAGALSSILGADYTMNAHRHCHYTSPGHPGGHWHQDGVNRRHHQIKTILAMYYPQDVTEDMGPTIVLPGTQYHNTPSTQMASYMNFKSQVPLNVKAGSVAIVHYDLWHSWMPNTSDKNRRMLKFLFSRASNPLRPGWNHDSEYKFNPTPFTLPIDGQAEAYKHRVIWRSVWDWLRGKDTDPEGVRW